MEKLCAGRPCLTAIDLRSGYDEITGFIDNMGETGMQTLEVATQAEDPLLRMQAEDDASLIAKSDAALWESREHAARWLAKCQTCQGIVNGICQTFDS